MIRPVAALAAVSLCLTLAAADRSHAKTASVRADRLAPSWLFAQTPGNVKDFYLLQFIEADTSDSDAMEAMMLTTRPKPDHLKALSRRTSLNLGAMTACLNLDPSQWTASDPECLLLGYSLPKAATLSPTAMKTTADKLEPLAFDKAQTLRLMAADDGAAVFAAPADRFFAIFNNCGPAYRQNRLNIAPDPAVLSRLAADSRFEMSLRLIATDPAMETLQKALIGIDYPILGGQEAFWLAMIALRHNDKERALAFLTRASSGMTTQDDKDKVLFWRYQLGGDKTLLTELIQSYRLNLYTLYAYEELKTTIPNIYPSALDNNATSPYPFDPTDPFAESGVTALIAATPPGQLSELARQFDFPQLEQYRAAILEKAYRYRRHYYISPFRDSLEGQSEHLKALMLAIGRQESRFIETSLSGSYAMGVMQLMPFLIRNIAKERGETVRLDDFFSHRINMDYAKEHLLWLQERLGHPLWIAYAYNGGIGFTKRMLDKGAFSGSNPYEPLLSLELVPYSESREYGKKVVTNYVIYRSIFAGHPGEVGISPTLHELLKSLTSQPRHP